MTSGIGSLQSALARSLSVPLGPAAHRDGNRPHAADIPPGAANAPSRSALGKSLTHGDREQTAQASKESLDAQLENAEKAALCSSTTIQYQRDDRNGRMYMHVRDKQTGELLYRIPRDYFQAPENASAEDHQVDLKT